MKNVGFLLLALSVACGAHLFFNLAGEYAFLILLLISIAALLGNGRRPRFGRRDTSPD
ncbi:hypothetical protein [Pseudomonas sp. NBRC 100443]|uniref:hypothetical protein n=1 Tax=Pseudomonas sp. NBRC 100443 TaxID=1113665 RepID=UPI00255343DC|nr:hypothetical protein [Pseudomonas sp. NBRC 100443]